MLVPVIAFALGIVAGIGIAALWALRQYERGFSDCQVMQAKQKVARLDDELGWRHA